MLGFACRVRDRTREDFVGNVETEGAVGFELRFIEKLIGSRFMGEFRMSTRILGHVAGLIARQ